MLGAKKIEEMTEIEARELAMLIDTDGCIYYDRSDYSVHIIVQMAALLPTQMAEEWGGLIYKRIPKGEKRQYRWDLGRRKRVKLLLEKIKFYLKVKKDQADIALRILDITEAKAKDWREEASRLGEELKKLHRSQPPDIDLTTLKGVVEKRRKG